MTDKPLIVTVEIHQPDGALFRRYHMNHDSPPQRATLGAQARFALEAGQSVTTYVDPDPHH